MTETPRMTYFNIFCGSFFWGTLAGWSAEDAIRRAMAEDTYLGRDAVNYFWKAEWVGA